jgi:hypothetical protein
VLLGSQHGRRVSGRAPAIEVLVPPLAHELSETKATTRVVSPPHGR